MKQNRVLEALKVFFFELKIDVIKISNAFFECVAGFFMIIQSKSLSLCRNKKRLIVAIRHNYKYDRTSASLSVRVVYFSPINRTVAERSRSVKHQRRKSK
jgi:hypothetical protein